MDANASRRSIFITGGGSGIGREVARYFGDRGWFVGIADINAEGMRETMEMIPGGFKYDCELDVRDRDAWERALEGFSLAAGGRIDVVFNNAGIGARPVPMEELEVEDVRSSQEH